MGIAEQGQGPEGLGLGGRVSGAGSPQVAVLPRCLEKLQLFQPAFEICPFETELSMDIAAALKVCLDPSWPSFPWSRTGLAVPSLALNLTLPFNPPCCFYWLLL